MNRRGMLKGVLGLLAGLFVPKAGGAAPLAAVKPPPPSLPAGRVVLYCVRRSPLKMMANGKTFTTHAGTLEVSGDNLLEWFRWINDHDCIEPEPGFLRRGLSIRLHPSLRRVDWEAEDVEV